MTDIQRAIFPPTPVATCQLQSVRITSSEYAHQWEPQDIAVVGIIWTEWEKLARVEMTKQPAQMKIAAANKLMNISWKSTQVRLIKGMYVRQIGTNRFHFDGSEILNMVHTNRANPKSRDKMKKSLTFALAKHYEELPQQYRPTDNRTPLHLHWKKAAECFRPITRRPRPPPRRATEETHNNTASHQQAKESVTETYVYVYVCSMCIKHTYMRTCAHAHTCMYT